MFTELKPFPGALEAIREVHEAGIKQVFCSTIIGYTGAMEKVESIKRDFPYLGKEALVLVGKDKNLVKGDVLVDDGAHNLMHFDGYRVLVNLQGAPYVFEHDCSPDAVLLKWSDYPKIIENLKGST
jgi:5'(3')-deoxyribonucleotidase